MKGVRRFTAEVSTINRQTGFRVEEHVSIALDNLQVRGLLISHWPTDQHEDKVEGVDHHILTNDGDDIGFQIKSSGSGLRKSRDEHPEVRVFISQRGETIEEIERSLILSFSLRKLV